MDKLVENPWQIFNNDCRQLLAKIEPETIDLTITSPPYCIGMEYEKKNDLEDFTRLQTEVIAEIVRITKKGGNICWQVGNHIKDNVLIPLDHIFLGIVHSLPEIKLRNRIVWTFGHGAHCKRRLSGRYETILWFSKGDNYYFDLDAIRVPQKYPGKKHYKGPQKGQFSGNPLGKNPGDVWEIPNVKAKHIEKTEHPCQFPVALAERLINALSPEGGKILDPFMGSGTVGVAALINNRRFIGVEKEPVYLKIAEERISGVITGKTKFREDKPVREPSPNESVSKVPKHFSFKR